MRIQTIILFLVFFTKVLAQEIGKNASDYSYQYALIEASRQKMIGNVNEAINLYNSCIQAKPGCDVAHYEKGTIYSAMGDNTKAEESLGEAYKLDKGNYWYGIAYSELLCENKKFNKSLKVLKALKKANSKETLTIDYKLAEIYSKKKKYSKALSLLRNIEKENGVSEMVSFQIIDIYKKEKKFNDAENVIRNLITSMPDIIEYQILLAETYTEEGDSVNALKTYQEAYLSDSSNIYAITNLADLYSDQGDDQKAYYFLSRAFLNSDIPVGSKIQTMMYLNKDRDLIKKNKDFIVPMVDNLLKTYPDNLDIKTVAYDFYNGIEEHRIALDLIKDILITKKDDYIIWQQAIYNASMLENYMEIITIGQEALNYFPNKNELYLFIGMAYFQKQDYLLAYNTLRDSFRKIKDDDELRHQFLIFLSEASYKAGFKPDAYEYYEQLIVADPGNDLVKNNYSYYLALDSCNLLRAKDLSYKTIQRNPENSTFLDTYAWILYKMGDFESAKYYSEKAVVINNESDPDIIFHYAEILVANGESNKAKTYFNVAAEKGFDKLIIEKRLRQIGDEK
jgi:tetratricopeptide (TPR) repeat protein